MNHGSRHAYSFKVRDGTCHGHCADGVRDLKYGACPNLHKPSSDLHGKGTDGLTESIFVVPLHERDAADCKATGLVHGVTSIADLSGYVLALAVTDDCDTYKYEVDL